MPEFSGPSVSGVSTQRDRTVGVTTQLASQASINFGSSIAGLLIPIVGSVIVVAVRQVVIALVLVPTVRPRIRGRSLRSLWPVLALGIILAGMNLSFYEAVGRIGLGIAVTIEFLGPLAIALITSRRILDVACALGAGLGVWLLAGTDGRLDAVGIMLALVAGAAWAAYILVARIVATRFAGLDGLTLASIVAVVAILPAALAVIDYSTIDWRVLGLLVATGVLCSAIPYSLDSVVLRRITPRLYAIVTSCAPVMAALFGWLILSQSLTLQQVLAIVLVCVAAATAFATQRDRPVSELEATAVSTP
ncbi:EamA family transporter [Terrimesophilobacter mesophilus]|uniref:EamA family transporter n=1 Tax=Terrimesophilobacter mesophilus TaxID=433647 RepID=A0A4R8VCJ0_9MICO|nr:EamA family transporter [Terrimesophilobacter mesophilus]